MQNHYEMTHDSWCLGSGWQTQSLQTQSVRYSGKYSHWKLICVTRQSDTAANTVIGRRTEQIKRRTASVIGRRTEQIRCTTTACNASVRYSGKHCHGDGDDTTEHARIP